MTRDRMTTLIEVGDRHFELIDTGGMGIVDEDNLTDDVQRQIEFAIHSADVILFVVDVQTGQMPLDEEVAERLRGLGRPVLLVANKADQPHQDALSQEFHRLGYGDFLCVSTTQNRHREPLLETIAEKLPPPDAETVASPRMHVAIVGRRNVGKSTFVNSLANSERMIVRKYLEPLGIALMLFSNLMGRALSPSTLRLRKRKSQRTDLSSTACIEHKEVSEGRMWC